MAPAIKSWSRAAEAEAAAAAEEGTCGVGIEFFFFDFFSIFFRLVSSSLRRTFASPPLKKQKTH